MEPISIIGFADPVSSWSHLLSAAAALFGSGMLFSRGRGNSARITALLIFSFSLVFLFSMSGVFHLLDRQGVARGVLQRLDHAGIWTLIAGTFTPMHVILFRGPWRWAILLFVWTVAITGLVLEVVFFRTFPEWLALSLFLGLGWVGAATGTKFIREFRDRSVRWLLAGGVLYSIGAIIDFARWPTLFVGVVGPHEIFHLFVILGAFSHWMFVYTWCGHPVASVIMINVHIVPGRRVVAKAVGESIHFEAESIEEAKAQIRDFIARRFHSRLQPVVRLRYYQEEHL